MKCFYKLILILFFLAYNSQAQQVISKNLNGKIVADSNDLEGVYIVNLKSNLATLSESGGYFSIPVHEGDTLLFSAVQFKGLKLRIKKSDMETALFFVKMETLMRQLDEVKINEYKNVNAVSLGLVSKNQKKYTPAERRLKTAGQMHWYSPLLIPVGGMSVDGLINSISGRTAMLKKEVIVEKKEILLKKIQDMYEEKYFSETLKIPIEYIKGFQYYCVENKELAKAVKDKNKTLTTFIMNGLALEYLSLLNEK